MRGTLNLVCLQTLIARDHLQSEGKHGKLRAKKSLQMGPFCAARQGTQRTGHSIPGIEVRSIYEMFQWTVHGSLPNSFSMLHHNLY